MTMSATACASDTFGEGFPARLRTRNAALRCAVLLLLALLIMMPAMASTIVSAASAEIDRRVDVHAHDYVRKSDDSRKATGYRIAFPGTVCSPCWGETVNYTTFGQPVLTYAARRYDGRWITLLIPVVHARASEATAERIRVLVDRLDLLYAAYRELLGWEPNRVTDPMGKQVFALRPDEPANFYGLAILGGDSSEYHNAVIAETGPDDDILSNVWVHELAHNFDPITLWDYGPDSPHDWTTIIQTWFARRQAHMDENLRVTWQDFEDEWLSPLVNSYVNNSALSWKLCAATSPRPESCESAGATYLTGRLFATLAKHVTGAQMKDWLKRGYDADHNGFTFATPEEKSDFAFMALADATQTDTRCIATKFRWYQGSGLTGAAKYVNLFPGCLDKDGDGSVAFDDCNDNDSSVTPGRPELAGDRKDNNCNGIVDESLVDERSLPAGDFSDDKFAGTAVPAAPIVIRGSLADRPVGQPLDVDSFSLATPLGGTLRLKLCSSGGAFWLSGLKTNNIAYGPLLGVDAAGCALRSLTEDTWKGFYVERKNAASIGGDYTLEISASTVNWPPVPAVTLGRSSGGIVRATLYVESTQGGLAGSELRWLQTGSGFVKIGAATDASALVAPVIDALAFSANGRPVQLRAQLWRDGMPIEPPSKPYLMSAPNTPLTKAMTEYRYAPLDYYFITSRDEDKAALDILGPYGWARTGKSFFVFASQVAETNGLTRYYFDKVAKSGARGSHFYTLLDSDKAALDALNPSNAQVPIKPYNEGVDSYAYLPVVSGVGGSCMTGLSSVYRAFRGARRFPDDPNHRFTTDVSLYNQLISLGWDGEGVTMCTPANP